MKLRKSGDDLFFAVKISNLPLPRAWNGRMSTAPASSLAAGSFASRKASFARTSS